VLSATSVALILILFRPLLLSSISPELGEARGVSARLMEVLFLAVAALATAMALPVVGALLVFSLMVGPASAARALTDRPLAAMLLSAVISVVTVWASIALSFASDWPIGFFVGARAHLPMSQGGHWRGPELFPDEHRRQPETGSKPFSKSAVMVVTLDAAVSHIARAYQDHLLHR
jgi:zinc/manganese transport system permease protein